MIEQNKEISLILCCDEKEEARRLRKTCMSFRDIGKKLNISTSSARNYAKDIELTLEQKRELLVNREKQNKKTILINYKIDKIEIIGKIKVKYPAKDKDFNVKEFILSILPKYID